MAISGDRFPLLSFEHQHKHTHTRPSSLSLIFVLRNRSFSLIRVFSLSLSAQPSCFLSFDSRTGVDPHVNVLFVCLFVFLLLERHRLDALVPHAALRESVCVFFFALLILHANIETFSSFLAHGFLILVFVILVLWFSSTTVCARVFLLAFRSMPVVCLHSCLWSSCWSCACGLFLSLYLSFSLSCHNAHESDDQCSKIKISKHNQEHLRRRLSRQRGKSVRSLLQIVSDGCPLVSRSTRISLVQSISQTTKQQ